MYPYHRSPDPWRRPVGFCHLNIFKLNVFRNRERIKVLVLYGTFFPKDLAKKTLQKVLLISGCTDNAWYYLKTCPHKVSNMTYQISTHNHSHPVVISFRSGSRRHPHSHATFSAIARAQEHTHEHRVESSVHATFILQRASLWTDWQTKKLCYS